MAILSTDALTLKFGGLTAVNGVSLAVHRGEIFSIIGPNGAGKTSLFNAVSGVYTPTSGAILIEDMNSCRRISAALIFGLMASGLLTAFGFLLIFHIAALWHAVITARFVFRQSFDWLGALEAIGHYAREQPLQTLIFPMLLGATTGTLGALSVWRGSRRSPEVCASFGLSRTFQNVRLFPQLSATENILIGMHRRLSSNFWSSLLHLPGMKRQEKTSQAKAHELLAFVELEESAERAAGSLPYGYQRRLEIARALASDPKVLLLDEPAAGMNPTESVQLMQLITRIKERGITVVLIEHDMKVVMGISDRIAVLDYGNLIAEGTPAEVRCNPLVIEAYLGTGAHSE